MPTPARFARDGLAWLAHSASTAGVTANRPWRSMRARAYFERGRPPRRSKMGPGSLSSREGPVGGQDADLVARGRPRTSRQTARGDQRERELHRRFLRVSRGRARPRPRPTTRRPGRSATRSRADVAADTDVGRTPCPATTSASRPAPPVSRATGSRGQPTPTAGSRGELAWSAHSDRGRGGEPPVELDASASGTGAHRRFLRVPRGNHDGHAPHGVVRAARRRGPPPRRPIASSTPPPTPTSDVRRELGNERLGSASRRGRSRAQHLELAAAPPPCRPQCTRWPTREYRRRPVAYMRARSVPATGCSSAEHSWRHATDVQA